MAIQKRVQVFFVFFGLFLLTGYPGSASFDRYEPLDDAAIESFSFLDENGYPISLDQYKGKVVVLNIWSLGCNPCLNEMPSLDRLSGLYGEDELVVIPLNVDGPRLTIDKLKKFYDMQRYRYLRVFSDPKRDSQRILKWQGLPTTYLIDKEGRLTGRLVGSIPWDGVDVQKAMDRMIQGKKPLKKKGVIDRVIDFFKGLWASPDDDAAESA